MTTAQLGIAVSSNADKAAIDLDALTSSSGRADAAVTSLSQNSRAASASAQALQRAHTAAARATYTQASASLAAARADENATSAAIAAALQAKRKAASQLAAARASEAQAAADIAAARASDILAAANDRAVGATHASTAALHANASAARMVQMNQRQLMFQMVDVGQALATAPTMGIYALQNLGFQFAQIGQMYWGQGGMGAALRDMSKMLGGAVVRIGPLIGVTALVAAGFAGLTYEINKTATTAVNIGDVVVASFQVMGRGIASAVMPAINQIITWMQGIWDFIAPGLKAAGNGIVGTFVFAYEAALATWSALPAAMGDVVITTANVIVAGVEEAINRTAELINAFIAKANENLAAVGLSIPEVGGVSFGGFSNPFAGAGQNYGEALNSARDNAFGTDYMGSAFGAISSQAQRNARDRLAEEAEKNGAGGSGLNAYEEATKRIREQTLALQDQQSAMGMSEEASTRFTTAMELLRAAEEAKLPITSELIDEINRLAGAYAAADEQARQVEAAMSLLGGEESPFVLMQDQIAGLNAMLERGVISWQQYGAASALAMADATSATLSAVSKQTSMLASAFEDNKAFALANAVVSGIEAVVSSYAAGARIGGPVVGAAFAAVAAAATAAQIGAIMSAKPGSASMGGAGGGGTAAAPTPVAPPEPSRTINLTLGGNGRYSRDEVRDLLEQLTGELNDGAGTKFKMAVNS